MRDGSRMMIVETSRRNAPVLLNRDVFAVRPHMVKSRLGRAYLAFCPDDERRELIAALRRSSDLNDAPALDPSRLHTLLGTTWRRGFGVRESDYRAGQSRFETEVHAIAVPIMARGRVAACLSLLWIGGTLSLREFHDRYLEFLRAVANAVAHRLRASDSARRRAPAVKTSPRGRPPARATGNTSGSAASLTGWARAPFRSTS